MAAAAAAAAAVLAVDVPSIVNRLRGYPVQYPAQQTYRVIETSNCPLRLYWFDNDEALLYSTSDGLLYPLDDFGLYAWFAIEAGADAQALIGELVERGAHEPSTSVFVQQLGELFYGRYQAEVAEAAPESAWAEVPRREASDCEACYQLLDIGFSIDSDSRALRQQLDVLLGLVRSTRPHPLDLDLCIEGRGEAYRLLANGCCIADGLAEKNLLPLILDGVRRYVYLHSDFSLALHAAALSTGERTLLMPALSGSGKSTLTAGLMARGWRVHSDEIAVLDASGQRVLPLPLAIGIKSSGWSLLSGRYPSLPHLAVQERLNGIRIRYLPIPRESAADEVREVTHLVFPSYGKDRALQLEPLSVVETIRRINQSDYHIPMPLGDVGIERLLDWLCALPCYSLRYGELDAALDALESLQ